MKFKNLIQFRIKFELQKIFTILMKRRQIKPYLNLFTRKEKTRILRFYDNTLYIVILFSQLLNTKLRFIFQTMGRTSQLNQ